ncbi:hypothetical protein SCACP_25070 [Sporomusa carbonis]|uniref:SymE family type I addiction module toxin n=1 Tax=Sporomusa carbonis TaxID=3076075 RepID=UPI003A71569A
MGKRILKIYQSVAYSKPDVPCIMLQGKWLRGVGFRTGSRILVEEGQGELIIRLVKEENNADYK